MSTNKLQHYRSGIFVDTTCSPTRLHAILVVGYEPGYWIIKNRLVAF
ncbi:MAG: C1 family peptidase [gamma proteobacterium symbiont of Lucinoma myriamae]|nr:C1 family peptidase [gamma proteobacterium symbiont of Lucinoma myriamae]